MNQLVGNGGLTFVKWAGGKTQLIEQYKPLFPKKIKRYFEPFVGSGAIFFFIAQEYQPEEIVLSDLNKELIATYDVIKNDVEKLIAILRKHKNAYEKNTDEYYYAIRSLKPAELSKIEIAARFIFLNKTCFNGLHRVNSKGEFNVPIGRYKNPDIVQEEKLRRAAALLKNVQLRVMSFEKVVSLAKKGDFVYFDPPYYPLKRESFTKYSKDDFLEDGQKLLKETCEQLDKKGVLFMQSNSDTTFIRNLYTNYKVITVRARRMINSRAEARGEISEVVVLNYDPSRA